MKLNIFIISLFLCFNCFSLSRQPRVVTTIPSLTEMMFFLDAGDLVVGVTPYCVFPSQAQVLPKVGSAFSLDYEAILNLKPSTVLLAPMRDSKSQKDLKKLGVSFLELSYQRYDDIEQSLYKINNYFNLNKQLKIKEHFNSIVDIDNKNPKKILIVIGETFRGDDLLSVRVASAKTYFSDLVAKLGHVNAYVDTSVEYPILNLEMLLKKDFDFILRVGNPSKESEEVRRKWKKSLFKNKIKFLFEDYTVVPGPRVRQFYFDLKGVLND